MKIFFIAIFTRPWDEEQIAKGFEANGHTVLRHEERGYSNKEFLDEIEKQKPDIVLFTKLRINQQPDELISGIKKLGIPTVSWTFDLLAGHPARESRVRHFPFLKADYVFLTDGGHEEEYRRAGVNKFTLRQGINDQYCYMSESPEKYDVVFVGTENQTFPYRQRLTKFLKETYGDRFTWIGRTDPFEARGHKLNELYASSKVVIGDCMYSDNYWSNRVYETLGRGGFMIHPRVKGIEEHYEPYKHFIPYDWGDFEGLKEKIDYFLEHKEERDRIRTSALEHTKQNHLWSIRCKEFIELYESIKAGEHTELLGKTS